MSNTDPVVASHLVKTYPTNQVRAVDNVSFSIEKGQILGVLGPNGAGKTTTIKMLLGLIEPSSGEAFLMGHNVNKERNQALAFVGAILEGARNIYWRLSARKNLEYFGTLRGLRGKTLKTRIEEVLDIVGMVDRADEETRYLSRGMQQKIALALSVLHDPAVLLLDEPTLGLDVQAARTIEETVRRQAKAGKSILLTTHQMDLAQRLCNRIVVIDKGKIVTQGTTQEIVNYFGDNSETVQIRLSGIIPEEAVKWINETQPAIAFEQNEKHTDLIWTDQDLSQSDLLAFLDKLNALDLMIVSVGRREATLEEVFVRLTNEDGEVSLG